jgi:hypothetical protein
MTLDPEIGLFRKSRITTSKQDAAFGETVTLVGHVECAGSGTFAALVRVNRNRKEDASVAPKGRAV